MLSIHHFAGHTRSINPRFASYLTGDVTRFVNVGDLSLRDSDSDSSEESQDPAKKTTTTTKAGWVAGTGSKSKTAPEATGSEGVETGTADAGRGSAGTGRGSRSTAVGGATGKGPESAGTRAAEGRSGRRVLGGGSSPGQMVGDVEAMDLKAQKSLRLSTEHSETSEAQDARRLRLEVGRKAQEEKEEEEKGKEEGKTKRRVRRRMKREIRKRHVNQLFIRGENVVLVSVLRP